MIESDVGYRVSLSMVCSESRYTAWAPDIGRDALQVLMREQYAIGEAVPSPCEWLGMFALSGDARAMCESHYQGVIDAG